MEPERIDDAADPRLADYRGVRDPEWLRRRGIFLAEGRQVVETLLDARGFRARSLLASEASLRALAPALARARGLPVYTADAATLAATSGVRFHQGCVAVGERMHRPDPALLLAGATRAVLLEDLSDPDNVGSIFRSARAFGADAALVSPRTASPLYRKAIRTSLGASLQLPFATLEPWPAALGGVRAAGLHLVALSPEIGAEPLGALARLGSAARVALLVGSEGQGLSPAARDAADLCVRIPMAPDADSLNVATACAIALQRLFELASGRA